MNEADATQTKCTLRLYESTLRAIAERTEEPGSALIAGNTLARVTAGRQDKQAP